MFQDHTATCFDKNSEVLFIALAVSNGLFVLDNTALTNTALTARENPDQLGESTAELWHRRLGHMNYKDIDKL